MALLRRIGRAPVVGAGRNGVARDGRGRRVRTVARARPRGPLAPRAGPHPHHPTRCRRGPRRLGDRPGRGLRRAHRPPAGSRAQSVGAPRGSRRPLGGSAGGGRRDRARGAGIRIPDRRSGRMGELPRVPPPRVADLVGAAPRGAGRGARSDRCPHPALARGRAAARSDPARAGDRVRRGRDLGVLRDGAGDRAVAGGGPQSRLDRRRRRRGRRARQRSPPRRGTPSRRPRAGHRVGHRHARADRALGPRSDGERARRRASHRRSGVDAPRLCRRGGAWSPRHRHDRAHPAGIRRRRRGRGVG